MNPVVVIPSYWAEKDEPAEIGRIGAYDHATPIAKPVPELETCLASLDKVRGVLRVIVLLVAPSSCEAAARARVDGICRMHPTLNALVVGQEEASVVSGVVEDVAPRLDHESVSLRGYGAIRNMGLAVAAILNHDVVVFLDDDEIALDENFLVDAVYGLGLATRQGLPIVAKSGCFLNEKGSPYARVERPSLRDRWWSKRMEFNQWMHRALSGTRISRSNHVCGGCFAVSARAFTRVGFDPAITRGEDLDYLFNLRMQGIDVWFDSAWRVRHLPPPIPSRAARFLQDVYRWEYEVEKIAAGNARIGNRQIRAEALRPYPSEWISPSVRRRIALTSLARAILGPERSAYLGIFLLGRLRARAWAQAHASSYFAFQTHWPQIMATLWDNRLLARKILGLGTPGRPEGDGRA